MEHKEITLAQLWNKLIELDCLLKEQRLIQKEILTFNEACVYASMSPSYLYKKTHKGDIPHFKPDGGKLFFKRSDLDSWRLRNPVKSASEINSEASTFITLKRLNKTRQK